MMARSLRLPLNSTVADACDLEGWRLPPPRSNESLSLQVFLTTRQLPSLSSEEDRLCWRIGQVNHFVFSSAKTWEALHPSVLRPWAKSIWFKGAVPRNAFNMWIATLNRLPTRARLATWGLQINDVWCLCGQHTETRDHLLLSCAYSYAVCNLVLSRLGPVHHHMSWAELLSWTSQQSAAAPSTLRKLVAQSMVYHLWKQRNNVLHNLHSLPPINISIVIDREVRNTITARRHRRRFWALMTLWLR